MFANCTIALGGTTWLGGGKYWHSGRASCGGSSHFVRGGWELCSVIFYLFLIGLSTGAGLGIGLNWLNRVEPSLTQWITGGVLHKMGGADFLSVLFILWRKFQLIQYLIMNLCPFYRKEIATVLGLTNDQLLES